MRLATTGLLPQGAYAAEVTGLSDREWHDLQRTAAVAAANGGAGRSWRRTLLVEGDATREHMVAPVVAWCSAAWEARAGAPGALGRGELAKLWQAHRRRKPKRWADARGPLDAAGLTLARLGWSWPTPWTLVTEQGVELDVDATAPKMVRWFLTEGARRGLEEDVGARLRKQGWKGMDGAMLGSSGAKSARGARARQGTEDPASPRCQRCLLDGRPPSPGGLRYRPTMPDVHLRPAGHRVAPHLGVQRYGGPPGGRRRQESGGARARGGARPHHLLHWPVVQPGGAAARAKRGRPVDR